MNNSLQQGSLFNPTAPTPREPIVLTIKGIEVPYQRDGKSYVLRGIPSFKTGKTAFAWRDKATGKIMARPLTLPEHRKWMELAILSIASQLRSALAITDAKMQTVASPRSWIASRVPLDDAWTWCPETIVRCELCERGEEGATITVERIR